MAVFGSEASRKFTGIAVLLGCCGLAALAILAAALYQRPSSASDRAYWIWNANDLSYVDSNAGLILYQGNVDAHWDFHPLGIQAHPLAHPGPVTLLFRLYKLGPPEDVATHYLSVKRRWARYGVSVAGLQVDYDSPSARLSEYSHWLGALREQLPGEPVSVTTLATYVFDAPEALQRLGGVADYLAMQLYAGYAPHDDIRSVVRFLRASAIPHRVGVTLSPEFPPDSELCGRHCLGISVFLNQDEPRL